MAFTEQNPQDLEQDCAFHGREFNNQFLACYLDLINTKWLTKENQMTR